MTKLLLMIPKKISWQTPTIDWSNQEISFDLNIEEKIDLEHKYAINKRNLRLVKMKLK